MSNRAKGIIAILVASLGFAFMSIFVKLAGDLPVAQKVIFRNIVSMIVAFIMVTINKESYYGKKENRELLYIRSAFGTIGMLLFFYSISNLVAADANALNKLSSFFLIGFSFLVLRERISKPQLIAIIIAFIGALLIIKPSLDFEILPYFTSIMAAMFAGAAYTMLRLLGNKEKYYTIVLFFSTFSFIVLLPFVAYNYVPMTSMQWLYLFLTGLGATIGQFGTTIAYKYAPAKEISIFNFSNVVFVTLLAIPILGELPDYLSLIGYFVIFGASFYMFKYKKPEVEDI
ncbi:EamA-like transporter family protein [Candidatus Izimaplasma bacterium HR1]|jgi:drug/metabolite transporter (DMT)-like permease|uniref:DMT family transporter n=1 Tax=Candidatus Izimoplasma sp. HR1 TaxID=1541959 RepID=UPI0004F6DF1F|nr:EamA-like transporter family protein [Candidatus Izimaplasma bacterium HR1]